MRIPEMSCALQLMICIYIHVSSNTSFLLKISDFWCTHILKNFIINNFIYKMDNTCETVVPSNTASDGWQQSKAKTYNVRRRINT